MAGRDFMSTVMGDHATIQQASTLLSSSPGVDTQGRKRTRSALKSLSINDASPEKKTQEVEKPVRKVSRRASTESDKENVMMDEIS